MIYDFCKRRLKMLVEHLTVGQKVQLFHLFKIVHFLNLPFRIIYLLYFTIMIYVCSMSFTLSCSHCYTFYLVKQERGICLSKIHHFCNIVSFSIIKPFLWLFNFNELWHFPEKLDILFGKNWNIKQKTIKICANAKDKIDHFFI